MVALKGACRNYDALWYCLARCRDVGSDYNIFFFLFLFQNVRRRRTADSPDGVGRSDGWFTAWRRTAEMKVSVVCVASLAVASLLIASCDAGSSVCRSTPSCGTPFMPWQSCCGLDETTGEW